MVLIILIIFIYITNIIGETIKRSNITILIRNKKASSNRELIDSNSLKINNFISIYNPYNEVSYISSASNQKGDLFIVTYSNEIGSKIRLIFALNSDASNYFTDNGDAYSFKILYINNNSTNNNDNSYPMITPLLMKGKESIVSLSHKGSFEAFDLENNVFYIRDFYVAMSENSEFNRNTFIYLKYFNSTNYVLNAYPGKKQTNNRFILQRLYFDRANLTKIKPKEESIYVIEPILKNITISCFEVEKYIECLYANINYYYIITVFDIYNLSIIYYNTTVDNEPITSFYIFNKGLYLKEYITAFLYYLSDNSLPKLLFKKLIIPDSPTSNYDYDLINYLGPITINSNNNYLLNSSFLFNHIIKMDENTIIYASTSCYSEIIMIIIFKLVNNDKNLIINYYKLELNEYNIKIYKDITIFNLKGFFGIGMTHYNYSLDASEIYSSLFIIGIGSSITVHIEEEIDILDEDYSIDISIFYSNIENNIFGYSLKGIRFLTSLNEIELGFYLFSTEKQEKIYKNEMISFSDTIKFKMLENSCVKTGLYSFVYESVIHGPNYSDLIFISDLVEYYPAENISLEQYYHPREIYGKKANFIFNISNISCNKTCKTCICNENNICLISETENSISSISSEDSNYLENDSINIISSVADIEGIHKYIDTTFINIEETENITESISYKYMNIITTISENIYKENTNNPHSSDVFINNYTEYLNTNYFKELFQIIERNISSKDFIIENIRNELNNSHLIILDYINNLNKDIIIYEDCIIYQITNSYNQKIYNYDNISNIKNSLF